MWKWVKSGEKKKDQSKKAMLAITHKGWWQKCLLSWGFLLGEKSHAWNNVWQHKSTVCVQNIIAKLQNQKQQVSEGAGCLNPGVKADSFATHSLKMQNKNGLFDSDFPFYSAVLYSWL